MDSTDRRWVAALTAIFLIVGAFFAILVPRGMPYDEPAHYNIVQADSRLQGMPVFPHNGVSYEAYQPPLYYFLMGLQYRWISSLTDPVRTFYLCRLITLAAAAPLVWLIYKFAREFSGCRDVAQWAGVLAALNPSLLAISSSVQNDTLAFLLTTIAGLWCIRWCCAKTLTPGRTILLSLVVGAALMTKSSTFSLLPLVGLLILLAYRGKSVWRLGIVAVIIAAATGWWFFRNHRVYDDWTGGKSVQSVFGVEAGNGQFHFFNGHDWYWATHTFITTYTIPVTYWRDDIKDPQWITAAVGVGVVCVILGLLASVFRRRLPGDPTAPPVFMACGILFAFLGVALWLEISHKDFIVSPRVAMPVLAGTLLCMGAALKDLFGRWNRIALLVVAVIFLAADVHLLARAAGRTHAPYVMRLV